jgi:hypothetical protein
MQSGSLRCGWIWLFRCSCRLPCSRVLLRSCCSRDRRRTEGCGCNSLRARDTGRHVGVQTARHGSGRRELKANDWEGGEFDCRERTANSKTISKAMRDMRKQQALPSEEGRMCMLPICFCSANSCWQSAPEPQPLLCCRLIACSPPSALLLALALPPTM